jgi:23S rRNA pseudouridine2605 synthase
MSDPTVTTAGDRLAKVIARSGLCSRRDAEGWIKDGRVTVNGKKVLTPAFNVSDKDKIKVDGEPLAARQGTRVWLYHKPAGLVVTEKDPEGRPTIFEALDEKGLPRVVSIGRLDINTEGLLMVTNDGGLKRVLELPATGWLRRYRVRAFGSVTQEQLDALKDGIEFDGVQYGPIDAQLERAQGSNTWMVLSLREGKNREVKNVLAALGLQVNRLIRVSYGPFQLGDLPEGAVETVPARVLREQLGRRLADEAGADFDSEMPEVAAQKKPVNPKLRAAAPGKLLDRDSPRKSRREPGFRFEDDDSEAYAAAARDAAPRQDRPGRAPKRAPKLVEERERDVRVVHFDDGTEGEHEVKYQRPGGEKRGWDPEDSSAANFGRPAHQDPKARKPREEGAEERPRKSFGDKPKFGDKKFGDRPPRDGDRKPFGAKKFTDKPGFGNRGRARAAGEGDDQRPAARSFTSRTRSARPFDDAGAPRKSFGDKPFADRKPFNRGPREDGDRPARKFGDKPAFGKKPYSPRGDAGDRPASPYGDKKPYTPRGDGDRPARTYTAGTKPSYGDKKPYAPRGDGGARPPREGGDRPSRSYTAGTKPSYGDKKPYTPRGDGGARPPREGGDRPARSYAAGSKPAYGGKPRAAGPGKPYAGKPGGARPVGGARPDGDKPRGPRKPRP